MLEKYSKFPPNAFKELARNAGMILTDFDVTDGSFDEDDIVGVTTGGVQVTENIELSDYGEDMDNVPKNTKELMMIDDRSMQMSGNFVTVNEALLEMLMPASDNTSGHIVPRGVIDPEKDFKTLYYVADYSDVNKDGTGTGAAKAGYICIVLKDTMNTSGFQFQSADKGKGQFAFTFQTHYSVDAGDEVPYDVYLVAGTPAST